MACRNQVVALLPKNPPKQNPLERSAEEVQATERTEDVANDVKVVIECSSFYYFKYFMCVYIYACFLLI